MRRSPINYCNSTFFSQVFTKRIFAHKAFHLSFANLCHSFPAFSKKRSKYWFKQKMFLGIAYKFSAPDH